MAQAQPRRSPLIAIIVIIDLGLAGAGTMLLAKGLAKPTQASQDSAKPAAPSTNAGSASPAPADVPPAGSAKPGSAAEGGPGSSAAASSVSNLVAEPRSDHKHRATKVAASPKPVDPVNTPPAASIGNAVNAKLSSSSGVFQLCHNNAGEVRGRIQIAFEVEPTGQVDHVAAVENTTGSEQLANCLVNTIAAWSFPPHTGDKADFVRPFNYE